VFTVISVLLAVCTNLQLTTGLNQDSPSVEARALYQQAADSIAARDTNAAIAPLETLIRDFPHSELSTIALPHLLECYLIAERPEDAMQLVEKNLNQLQREQVRSLAVLACRALPKEQAAVELIDDHLRIVADTSELAPYRRDLHLQLATRYEQLGDYRAAIETLESGAVDGRENEVQFRLPLAWAHHERTHEKAAQAIELLSEIVRTELSAEQNAAVQMELVEAYLADDRIAEALQQLDELSDLAAGEAQVNATSPAWAGSVQLRRAELYVMTRQYKDAVAVIEVAKREFNTFAKRHEFDFLLARCAIADIDFEKALVHLANVEHSPAADINAIARAIWMQGEVNFLQRNYAQALAAYERVAGMRGCEQWQARSLVQSGKCYELLEQPLNAMVAYERLLRDCNADNNSWSRLICNEATERMASLKSSAIETR
jgi:tetratricopeptide (TPR) repeat protein